MSFEIDQWNGNQIKTVQCDIFIYHFPYFISESNCYKMDHLYYCLKLCPNSVHSHCHDYTEGNVKKKQLLQYTFVNTCTFHNPFQFWYNSNELEHTHSDYFRSSCSQFTIIVITLVHCLQIFAFMTYFFYNIQLIMCNLLLYRWPH